MQNELMNRVRVPQIVEERARALACVEQAWDTCHEAREATGRMLGGTRVYFERDTFGALSKYDQKERQLETYRTELDRQIWRYLLEATELGPLMGSKQREAFEKGLERDVPHATMENIFATFSELVGRADEIFAQTVADLFSQLQRRFKSHEGFGFGERLIFAGAVDWMGFRSHIESIMMDLSTVLYTLDGKPRPTRSTGIFALIKQGFEHDRNHKPVPGEVQTEYVRVKWFKNQNAHVWILRDDLRAKMNEILRTTQPDALCAR